MKILLIGAVVDYSCNLEGEVTSYHKRGIFDAEEQYNVRARLFQQLYKVCKIEVIL